MIDSTIILKIWNLASVLWDIGVDYEPASVLLERIKKEKAG